MHSAADSQIVTSVKRSIIEKRAICGRAADNSQRKWKLHVGGLPSTTGCCQSSAAMRAKAAKKSNVKNFPV